MRLSVDDVTTGLTSDVHIDPQLSDRVSDVLALISAVLPVRGVPVVDGVALVLEQPIAVSPLREGTVLHYGRGLQPVSRRPTAPLVLRVESGADAGTELALWPGRTVILGRAQSCHLVLDDPEVSRRHARLLVSDDRVILTDLGSRNGVLLGGQVIVGARHVDGEAIQIGRTRLVVEATVDRGARVSHGDRGELVVSRPARSRPERFEPPTVMMPARPSPDDDRASPRPVAGRPLLAGWLSGRRRRRHEGYRAALLTARAAVEAAVDDEDADLRIRWPDPATTVRAATTPTKQLWERRPGDDDWLAVRVGTADLPSTVGIIGVPGEGWSVPVLRRAPLGLSLVEQAMLGLAGPPGWLEAQLAWMVIQLAVHHSPDELRLAVIAPDAGERQLGWMRWLPHIRAEDGAVRAGWDAAGAERMIEELGNDLRQAAAGRRRGARAGWPDVVVVLAGAADLHAGGHLTELLDQGPAHGVRFVCAEHDERHLPDGARAYLMANDCDAVLHVDDAETSLATDQVPAGACELVARSLAPLRDEGGVGSTSAAGRRAQRATALHWFDVGPRRRPPRRS